MKAPAFQLKLPELVLQVVEKLQSRIKPLGKIGQPDYLVGPVIFLSSEASNWMTGQTIVLDGGQTLLDLTP